MRSPVWAFHGLGTMLPCEQSGAPAGFTGGLWEIWEYDPYVFLVVSRNYGNIIPM